jgi:hypothetical protein
MTPDEKAECKSQMLRAAARDVDLAALARHEQGTWYKKMHPDLAEAALSVEQILIGVANDLRALADGAPTIVETPDDPNTVARIVRTPKEP